MRYIKTYESFNVPDPPKRRYWRVPTGNKLKIALKKIGAPQHFIEKLLIKKYDYEYIYVGEYYSELNWGWDNSDEAFENETTRKYIEFAGTVEVDDSEVSSDKYNL